MTHSIIQLSRFTRPGAAGILRPAIRNKEKGRRGSSGGEKEGRSDRKRREWEHISRPVLTDIFALSVESHCEYQYESMERKHSVFFPPPPSSPSSPCFFFRWAIHAHKKTIQVDLMANLWGCAWLCELFSFGSAPHFLRSSLTCAPASAGRKTKRKHCASSATGLKSAVGKPDPEKFSSKQAEGFFFFFLPNRQAWPFPL